MFQEHICPLTGIDCFSDDQILPLLLASLFNCGMASPRLYRLIRDRKVWRYLLKEVDITKEQMEELRLFGRGDQWDQWKPGNYCRGCEESSSEIFCYGKFQNDHCHPELGQSRLL